MERITSDVLIIGGGLAAMTAALEASESTPSVLIVSKSKVGASGATLMAGANFAAVLPEAEAAGDTVDFHIEDTIQSGCHINDVDLVRTLALNAPRDLCFLEALGVQFLKKEGRFDIRKPPGHRNARTAFTINPGIPVTIRGKTITAPLRQALISKGIRMLDGVTVVRLVVRDGRLIGALGVRRSSGEPVVFATKTAVIACGGGGALYKFNTNPADVTGDSYALALEAGCMLRDMEFVQFYPCVHLRSPRIPIYSPILSDGGVLRDKDGYRFMARYAPDRMELATRDIVAQAIFKEAQSGRGVDGGVYLDLTQIPTDVLAFRFPDLISIFRKRGVDLYKQWIHVAPAAHFFMGGAVIDACCRTSVVNLFAAGEATGGVHGANRLSGNGLSEPMVFGRIAGREAARNAATLQGGADSIDVAALESMFGSETVPTSRLEEIRREIRKVLWEKVGIVRDRSGLQQAVKQFEQMLQSLSAGKPASLTDCSAYLETRSMLITSLAISKAALVREESRGAHFREDFPESRQDLTRPIFVTLADGRPNAEFSEI